MTNITTETQKNKHVPSELKTSFQQSHSDKAETYLYQVQSSGATIWKPTKKRHTHKDDGINSINQHDFFT
jgi:uncharacterized protein (DUF2249 family)